MTTINIDGTDYVRADSIDSGPTERRIVIGQRGWCFVGLWHEDGDNVTLTDASVIRRWGTTRGLGELAAGGPTPNTELDPAGTVRMHRLAIVATLDVTGGDW